VNHAEAAETGCERPRNAREHAERDREQQLMSLLDRFRRSDHEPEATHEQKTVIQIDATSLSRVFSAPMWLRGLGLLAWFLAGVSILFVGLIVLLGLTSTIVLPVTVGAILATVAGPLVTKLQGHGLPRPAGAALVLLGILAFGALILLLVFGGIHEQSDEIKDSVSEAVDTMEGWANDVGVGGTSDATDDAKSSTVDVGKALLEGIQGITSFVFFLTFTAFSTFFLLKDGPQVRRWINRSMGIPVEVAATVTANVIKSLRRYFLGVTAVAVFNGMVVGLGAYLLGVPLWGTIAVVTLALAYIPFIGAFVSGTFAVLLTLSSQGTTAALIMLVIVILANGLLQNIVQPIAFGATLDLNPLVILIVTIGFGSLFGTIGMILAAPLTSAAVHISQELARAKAAESGRSTDPPEPAFDPTGR
jgi:predicted PurR-regulated permease PerM